MRRTLILPRKIIDCALEQNAVWALVFGAVALVALLAELLTFGALSFVSRAIHDLAALIFAYSLGVAHAFLKVLRGRTE